MVLVIRGGSEKNCLVMVLRGGSEKNGLVLGVKVLSVVLKKKN